MQLREVAPAGWVSRLRSADGRETHRFVAQIGGTRRRARFCRIVGVQAPTITTNLLNPPVLFFVLGMLATWVRSDLRIPSAVQKILSLYLMWAIGVRGGMELAHGGVTAGVAGWLLAGGIVSAAAPVLVFGMMRRWLGVDTAAALGASYGSVSAVTFITASAYLESSGIPFGGHMVALLALMESPAIVSAVLLHRLASREGGGGLRGAALAKELLREALVNGPVFLLLGSLVIGWVAAERAVELRAFTHDIFPGMLSFFLLDMGLVASQRLRDSRALRGMRGVGLAVFGMGWAVVMGSGGAVAARMMGMGEGDGVLFAVLCGSASYIAAPAAMRMTIPRADAGVYLPMALAVTFPFNVTVGIPLFQMVYGWAAGVMPGG